MDHDEEKFQFCSLESEGVQAIQPSIEVVRQWHSEGNGKGRKRKKNTLQPQLGVDDDEGEDYFAFQAKPSKTTKSSFKDLSDKVLIKAFIEGVPEQARNTEYAEHRALLHKELKKSFPKWMHQIQYALHTTVGASSQNGTSRQLTMWVHMLASGRASISSFTASARSSNYSTSSASQCSLHIR
jgi:hypothetical protein